MIFIFLRWRWQLAKQRRKNRKQEQEKEAWRVLEFKLESCGTSRDFFDKRDGEGGKRGVARLERNGNVN